MDPTTIEEHKSMMKKEALPVLESKGDVSFAFDTKRTDDGVILEMTAFLDGKEYSKKSRKIEQLNG